ncbi:GNAT family N-acetyltransferase [Glycomyces paridis]|uniref:GNAT family N-acetyltransferase n=1 Tax=Glycomyces paridis TaxID=2126555 RepID=A0A4S8PFB6_9ACTN|nr:GNAT family protein [Glycomyces paridis]THV29123.1 GNAT family N-acetyltransferase [Glycomyces paridis]
MLADLLPILRLRLRTERLELRLLADYGELEALARLAADGVHDPGFMPFSNPWTVGEPEAIRRGVAIWYHRAIGRWDPEDWAIPFVVFCDGEVIGTQVVAGKRFALAREVDSGSWLGLAHQGKGLGTEMRAAVLHLAFEGLGAQTARSGSYVGNDPSERVSKRLGYRPDGEEFHVVQDQRRHLRRWRVGREDWEAHRRHDVAVEGLDADVLDMLGLGDELGPEEKEEES